MTTKRCARCAHDFDTSNFHADKRKSDGLQSSCKPCQAEIKRAYYERNKERLRLEALGAYREKKRDGLITDEQKARKREYDRRYRSENADRLDAIKAKWRQENSELIRAVRHTYKAKRRAQEKAGDSSRAIAEWLSSQELVCRWCKMGCADRYHIDHIIPLARGGQHVVANLCIACPSCNLRKNAKLPEEWLSTGKQEAA